MMKLKTTTTMLTVLFVVSVTYAAPGWYGNGPRWMYNSTETMYYGNLQAGGTGFSFCYSLRTSGGLELWPRYVYAKGTWNFSRDIKVSSAEVDTSSGLIDVRGTYSGASQTRGIYVRNVPGDGVGYGVDAEGGYIGVYGFVSQTGSNSYFGIMGAADSTNTGKNYGVNGEAQNGTTNYGVVGAASGGTYAYGIYGSASGATTSNWSGYFAGDVFIAGTTYKRQSKILVDDPTDPENNYLAHDVVGSNEMKNIYDGVVTLDEFGRAVVKVPRYVETLNVDFRYQLTCIGGWAPVYIAQKLKNNRFIIEGGNPGMEVSWMLTGIRNDPFARDHRTSVRREKIESEKGRYLYPEGYGFTEEVSVAPHQRLPREKEKN